MQLFRALFYTQNRPLCNFVLRWFFFGFYWSLWPMFNYDRWPIFGPMCNILGRCAMFPSTARLWNWGDNAPHLLQAPPDPKHRTPPYSPLRGLTFVERAMFLTGSSKAFRLRCSTMLPNPIVRLLQLETKAGEQVPTSIF